MMNRINADSMTPTKKPTLEGEISTVPLTKLGKFSLVLSAELAEQCIDFMTAFAASRSHFSCVFSTLLADISRYHSRFPQVYPIGAFLTFLAQIGVEIFLIWSQRKAIVVKLENSNC